MDKSSRKKLIITGGAVSAICLIIVIVMLAAGRSSDKRVSELLTSGDRYLSELDYERAIASYQAAIEIDPKCEEAYLGLAEVYVAMEDYEAAIAVLNQGIEETESEALTACLEEVREASSQEGYGSSANDDANSDETESDVIHYDDGSYGIPEYDENGNLIRETKYSENEYEYSIYEYGENGEIIKETLYLVNENGEGIPHWGCEYDEAGNLIKEIWYDEAGETENYYEAEYDENGTQRRYAYYKGDGTLDALYEYDENGTLRKWTFHQNEGELNILEYNEKGDPTKTTYYNLDGTIYCYIISEYDESGNRTDTWYNADGTPMP